MNRNRFLHSTVCPARQAVAVLLCFCFLLTGCTSLLSIFGEGTPHYSDIEYVRPDLTEIVDMINEARSVAAAPPDFDALWAKLEPVERAYNTFYTMSSLADIRRSIDTSDSYYTDECAYFAEATAPFEEAFEGLYQILAKTQYVAELEEAYYGAGYFEQYAAGTQGIYEGGEFGALQTEENRLIIRYQSLINGLTVTLGGTEYPLYGIPDTTEQKEYDAAVGQCLSDCYDEAVGIYADLCAVRTKQALLLGYDSYREMAYDGYPYSVEQADAYLSGIAEKLSPLAYAFSETAEQRLYGAGDDISLSPTRLISLLRDAVRDRPEQITNAFSFMFNLGYYDIAPSPTKVTGAFTSYLWDYQAPMLVMNPTGYLEDIFTYAHEFGHYADGYQNPGFSSDTDLSETFSQSMELLVLDRLTGLNPSQMSYLRTYKAYDLLDSFLSTGYYAAFEAAVLALEEDARTPQKLLQLSQDLIAAYGMDAPLWDFDPRGFLFCTHLFEYPCYVIHYSVSADVSMQIYEAERAEPGAGCTLFCKLLDGGEAEPYPDALTAVGLVYPVGADRFDELSQLFTAWQRDTE